MKKLWFLLLLILLTLQVSAQQRDSFPADPAAFLPAFEPFLLSLELKELEEQVELFRGTFLNGDWNEAEQLSIIEVANAMHTQRMTVIPYFRSYLEALLALKQLDTKHEHTLTWHQVLLELLNDPDYSKTEFRRLLDQYQGFFTHQLLRSSSGGTSWMASSPDFVLLYEAGVPYIAYTDTDLLAFRKSDTMRISHTSGRYHLQAETWEGDKGRVDWETAENTPEIYVTFAAYQLDLKKSFLEIDSVRFYHSQYFGNRGIMGNFSDRITSGTTGNPSYPRFTSLEGDLQIDDFGPGIAYRGGFSIQGHTVYGTGVANNMAQISIRNSEQDLVFKGQANRFSIREGEALQAQDVAAVIYHQNDSVYHPSVDLRYSIDRGTLELSRGNTGNDRVPFYSSAHELNIQSEYLTADLRKDSIFIGKSMASFLNKAPVTLESIHYFDRRDFERLQGLSSVNPLVMLMRVYVSYGESRYVPLSAITALYGAAMSEESVLTLLYSLAEKGFVSYNPVTRLVEIREKVRHFVESYFDQRDYDRIRLVSDTLAVNGFLQLDNQQISLLGVRKVELSPFRRVGLLPDQNRLLVLPNMDIDFSGQLFAGYADFQGKDFHFDYADFLVKMDSLKTIRLFPPAKDPIRFPNTPAYALTSSLENTQGRLYIDRTDNKSGKDSIPGYPRFVSSSTAYIYYDNPEYVKDTNYLRDVFYFELAPFTLDSLTNYQKEQLHFPGKLVSAGIFPDIQESAYVREDFSLGFAHQVPFEGYSTYANRGRYTGLLDLSNRGLLGNGTLDYLGASIRSEDLVFRPQQATGTANAFDLPEVSGSGVATPLVHADAVRINWLPYQDSLYITSDEFLVFKTGDFIFDGTLTLTPTGVKGRGFLDWEQARVGADLLSFGANSISADSFSIAIRSRGAAAETALRMNNLRGHIDFDEGLGLFEGNDSLYVSLDYNNFVSDMDALRWDLRQDKLGLRRSDSGMGTFISTRERQDSLQFRGKTAGMDLLTNNLVVKAVPYVQSADALIYPDSNQVVIMPGGTMATFEKATILADSSSKRHKIIAATVDVKSRKSFTASGLYEYNVSGQEQSIAFSEIVGGPYGKGPIRKRPTVTRASGTVAAEDSFLIDHKTLFQGEISLFSPRKDLHFKGYAQLTADKLPQKTWFYIDCDADKSDLLLPYAYPRDQEGYKVFTGFFLGRDMPIVYPAVMMPPYTLQDRKLLDVTGVFRYQKNQDQFIFGDSAKVVGKSLVGNSLVFDNATGIISGSGRLGLCDQLSYTSLDAVGTATTSFWDVPDSLRAEVPPPPFELEVMAGVNFILPDRLFRFIEAEVERNRLTSNLIPYLADKEKYKMQLSTLFEGRPELPQILQGVETGALTFPNNVNDYTILVTDLKMKWDMDYQSFVSTQPQIGLVSINGTPINKRIEGYVEYKMPGVGGDRFYYYLKFPSQIFYYFGFRQGVLEVYSNDSQFMDAAAKMKSKELVTKMSDGRTYEILLQTASRANMFVRRVKAVN